MRFEGKTENQRPKTMEQINKGREEYFDTIAEKLCQLLKDKYLTDDRLKQAVEGETDPHLNQFLLQIQNKKISLDELLTSRPHQLAKLSSTYQLINAVKSQQKRTKTKKENSTRGLKWFFCYESFRDDYATKFYSEHLDVRVCVYCNRNYAETISSSNPPKRLYDFDHFFDQATYPYLALSFYNLIPSCPICNSRLKGQEKFNLKTHVHPFAESFNDLVRFVLVPYISKDTKRIAWKVDLVPKSSEPELVQDGYEGGWKRAYRNAAVFYILERYEDQKATIKEMIAKRELYPDDYMQSLVDSNPELFPCGIEDVKRTLLGASFTEGEISKRPLGKLIYDLYEQLWESNP